MTVSSSGQYRVTRLGTGGFPNTFLLAGQAARGKRL
jgi:hypothetical protein